VREVFNLSASDNSSVPSAPMLLAVLSENEMKQEFVNPRDGVKRGKNLI
jgi:hypothetical protein